MTIIIIYLIVKGGINSKGTKGLRGESGLDGTHGLRGYPGEVGLKGFEGNIGPIVSSLWHMNQGKK